MSTTGSANFVNATKAQVNGSGNCVFGGYIIHNGNGGLIQGQRQDLSGNFITTNGY